MLDPRVQLDEGLRYEKLGMLEQALKHYEQTAGAADDPSLLGEAYRRESLVYRAWCKWDKAIEAARRCATVARMNNHSEMYAAALNAEAIVHQERGDFDRAVPLLEEILGLKLDDKLHGVAHQNLGSIYAQRVEFARAEEHFRTSYASFQRAGYRWGEAFALNNTAALHLASGKLKLAEVIAGQAMIAAKKVGDLELLGVASMNAAEALAGQGEVARAETLATTALDYFVLEENDLRRAQCMRVLGDIKIRQGEASEARRYYRQALGLAQSVGSELEMGRITDCLELVASD
jgi:tetratricopeptide (TPR) repeat protein